MACGRQREGACSAHSVYSLVHSFERCKCDDGALLVHLTVMLFDSLCVRAVSEVASDLTKTCVNLATQVMLQGVEAAHERSGTRCRYDSVHEVGCFSCFRNKMQPSCCGIEYGRELNVYIHNIDTYTQHIRKKHDATHSTCKCVPYTRPYFSILLLCKRYLLMSCCHW